MILSTEELRQYRPVGNNFDDDKLNFYIDEAINLFVIPAISVKVYKDVEENPEDNKDILEPYYYNNNNCRHNGLKKAIAYLAYSRIINQNAVNATTYGVDYLQSEYSDKANTEDIAYTRNTNKEIGLAYLKEVVDYLKFINKIPICNKIKSNKYKVL